MPVLRNIPIALTVNEVLEAQTPRRRRGSGLSPAMAEAAQRAIDLAQTLCAPATVYAEFNVQGVTGEHVKVNSPNGPEKEYSWSIGPHADLLAPATRLLAAVYTIGPALEKRVDALNRAGESLTAYWLDTVGVLALGAVGEALRCIAEEKASERGWGVSAALSPGSLVGWSIQGQRDVCALLPLADISVRLNKHCVLEPHKSASVVVGMGPGYQSHTVGSLCHLCALAGSCWRRR